MTTPTQYELGLINEGWLGKKILSPIHFQPSPPILSVNGFPPRNTIVSHLARRNTHPIASAVSQPYLRLDIVLLGE